MSNGAPGAATIDPIKHVFLLALENRSFDHMLGACQAIKPDIEGIPALGQPHTNLYNGKLYPQVAGAARIVVDDPRHEIPHVLVQMKPNATGAPSGFVEDTRPPTRC